MNTDSGKDHEAGMASSRPGTSTPISAYHHGGDKGRCSTGSAMFGPTRTPTPNGGRNSSAATGWRSQASVWGSAALEALDRHCGEGLLRSGGVGARPGTARSAAHEEARGIRMPPRPSTAMDSYGTRGDGMLPPLGARRHSPFTHRRSPNVEEFLGDILPPSAALADDLRPTRAHSPPAGTPQDPHKRPVASWAAPSCLPRPPGGRPGGGLHPLTSHFGGRPRSPYRAASEPAKCAAPHVRPHNAWCTFVEWAPPANGVEDAFLSYELNCREEGSAHAMLLTDIGAEPMMQFNGLEPGRTYFFQVRASNFEGFGPWSDWSSPYVAPTMTEAMKKMEPVTHSAQPFAAVIEWSEPCGQGAQIIGYRVQYGPDPEDLDTLITQSVFSRRTSLVISNLLPNHTYYYRLCAISEVGESDWTEWSEGFATRGMAPDMPDVPKLRRAEPWALHLEWEEPFTCGFEVVQYEVAASTDASMEKPVFLKSPIQTQAPCSICVNGLEPCTKYYFRLRAQSAMGTSAWSRVSPAYSTIGAVPSVCETPKVVEVDDDIVALEITMPESNGIPISEFVVRWSEKACMHPVGEQVVFPQNDPEPRAGEKIYCRLRGIAPDLWLHFDCAASNAIGLGQFSEPTKATRTALGLPPPPPPPIVAERTATTLLVELIDVREGRYELRYDFREDFASAELCGVMREALHSTANRRIYEFPVTNLTNNGPYYFSVRALATAGKSHWSPPSAPVMLCGGAPAKMSAPLLVEAQSCSSLLISFIAPANFGTIMGGTILEYELKYSQDESALQAYKDPADVVAVSSPSSQAQGSLRKRFSSSESATAERMRVFSKRIPCKGHMMEAQHIEVGNLITGRSYVFQIRALSYNGVGPWSDCSDFFETLSSPPAKPAPPEMAAGFDSPFSLTLRLLLPEPNGKPIEACRLRYFGPSWTHGVKATEWQDWGRPPLNEIEPEDCEVSKVSIDGQKEIVWQHTALPLAPGAMFRFMWQCRNASGESEWSEPSEVFQTQPSMPEQANPPYIADEEDRTDNSLKLTWDPPFDNGGEIEHYTLQWTNNFRLTNFTTIDNIKEPTFELTGLQPNQWYYFKVCAYNAVGVGKYSNLDVAKAPDMDRGAICTRAREPGPPSNVKVKAIERVPGAVHLSWEKPTDDGGSIVTRYKVILSTTPDFEVCSEIVQKASRECKITDIRPDTVYYFDVAAANSVGYGLPSGIAASCRTNAIPPQRFVAPQKPRRPQLQLLPHDGWRSSELQVQWSCPEMFDPHRGFIYDAEKQTHMILYYVVQIRGGTGDPTRAEDIQEHEHVPQLRDKRSTPRDVGNTAIFGSLLPGRHYQAYVQSVSAAGNSAWSVASVTVRAPPGVPDIVEPVSVVERTCQSMTIEWNCPGGNGEEVLGFWVRYRTEKILQGWNNGAPLPPESAGEDTGHYLDVKVWENAIYLKLEDCSCHEEVLSLPPSPTMADSHRESHRGSLESDLKFDLDQLSLGVPCRWKVESLLPASYYTFEIIAQNVVGASDACLSDAIRSGATPPGPSGCVKGLPEEATTHSVSMTWRPCVYLGGEPLLDFDVAWKAFRFDDMLDPSKLVAEGFCQLDDLKHSCVDAETTYLVAEDLRPGDVVVALVRSRNEVGHSSWSRFPVDEELPSLSALPDIPNVLEAPPTLHRGESQDHKPYALSAKWVCPPQNGKWIEYFRLEFTPEVEEHGAERHEMIIKRPEGTVWRFGDELHQACVHNDLVPGIAYTLRIMAVSEQGEARDWSEKSNLEVAPPDYPAAPKPPTSMWQWPYAIQLDWVEPWMKGSPLESCQALYSLSPHFTDPVEVSEEVANKDLHKHTLIVDGFNAATTVWFRLRVRNAVGWSAWSIVSPGFTTSACKPAPPDMPVVLSLESRSLTVGWDPPDSHGAEILDYTVLLVDPPYAVGLQAALVEYDTELQKAINKAIDADGDGDISLEELKLATQREEIQELVQGLCDQFDRDLDEKLKPREKLVLSAPADPREALKCKFSKLLGGIRLAVAVRARNDRGFSEWSESLENLVTPSSVPEPCPALELLEASSKSFLCRYRLPYDCGEPILRLEYKWTHVVGPIQRHMALGGVVESGKNMEVQQVGSGPWELPDPRPASAKPEGYGGSGEGWIEELSPGTEYDVQVRAENCKGFGQYSKPVRMITLPGKPDRPLQLRHSDKTTAARPPKTVAAMSREVPRAASPTPTAMATVAVAPPSFPKMPSSAPTRSIHAFRAEEEASLGGAEAEDAAEIQHWQPPGEVRFEELEEPAAEEPVLLPTVFFSHTARLAVPEVISVAAGDRATQRSRSPSPGPYPPWQDMSFGIPSPSPRWPERR